MNLVKELEPFNEDLDNWKAGHGFSDREKLKQLAPIWVKFAQENVAEIYGNPAHKVKDIDLACGSCVKDMLQFLYNWREILKKRLPPYHKMVPNGTPNISKKDEPKPENADAVENLREEHDAELADAATDATTEDQVTMDEVAEGDVEVTEHDIEEETDEDVDKLSEMKWADLIKLAKEKEVSTYRKKREEIEKELRSKL